MKELKEFLNDRFFGISNEIEDICEMVEPWSKVPECYIRPLIINLWGMTGTGKTSLVRDIANFLKIPLVEIDLGSYASSSESKDLSNKFWEDYSELSGKPCIVLIDEVHIARTISEDGDEIDRDNIRGFWSLLSDGKIVLNDRLEQCRDLEYFFEEVLESYQKNEKKIKDFESKKSKKDDYEEKEDIEYLKKNIGELSFNTWTLKILCKVFSISFRETRNSLKKDFMKEYDKLKELSKTISFQPVLDFSKSLIFLSGNLDNVYMRVNDFDPDLCLEKIYKHSREINFAEVKKELSSRFRPEQISRFGNNHIIYPSLRKEAYDKIIEKDLIRIKEFFANFDNFGFDLEFDSSINDLAFREGVVPAQGARSVLSTITSIIESSIITFIAKYRSENEQPKEKRSTKVKVSCDFVNRIILFKMDSFEYKKNVKLKVDDLRKPRWNESSIARSVHEAGHVAACVLFANSIPDRATSYTVASNSQAVVETFNMFEGPDDSVDFIEKQIFIGLGSFCSMELIFGREYVSGTSSDIKTLTKYLMGIISEHGFLREGFGLITASTGSEINSSIKRPEDIEKIAEDTLEKYRQQVLEKFQNNIDFILEISANLVSKPQLSKADMEIICENNGIKIKDSFSYREKFLNQLSVDGIQIMKGIL